MFIYKLKNKKLARRIFSVLIGLLLIFQVLLISGCSAEQFQIYFGVEQMPQNLDPQKAQSYGELLAVRNCFRGLVKEDSDGNVVLDLAEKFNVSEDGLTYTFLLKASEWSNGDAVTADDFVFALTRASDPVTASPSAQMLLNISGAAERLNGNASAVLGVKAPEKNTLVFTLTHPDKNFLSKLTSAVFMPCNREFFENCGGKYGLSKNYILTNGKYTVSQWTADRYVCLKPSDTAKDNKRMAKKVYITTSATGKNCIQRINDREIGMTVDDTNDYASVDTSKFNVITAYNATYALVFNKNTEVGGNEKLTSAFARALHGEYYASRMNDRFNAAKSVMPPECTVIYGFNENIALPDYSYQFDSSSARNDFLEAVSELKGKKLPNFNVLTYDNSEINSILSDIVSQWQSNLGAYVNIETVVSKDALLNKIASGSYTVALVPLSGSAVEILSDFTDSSSPMYLSNDELDSAVEKLYKTDDLSTAIDLTLSCAQILSLESSVIPIVSVPTAFVYDINYKNVRFYSADSTVDFSIIYK